MRLRPIAAAVAVEPLAETGALNQHRVQLRLDVFGRRVAEPGEEAADTLGRLSFRALFGPELVEFGFEPAELVAQISGEEVEGILTLLPQYGRCKPEERGV